MWELHWNYLGLPHFVFLELLEGFLLKSIILKVHPRILSKIILGMPPRISLQDSFMGSSKDSLRIVYKDFTKVFACNKIKRSTELALDKFIGVPTKEIKMPKDFLDDFLQKFRKVSLINFLEIFQEKFQKKKSWQNL